MQEVDVGGLDPGGDTEFDRSLSGDPTDRIAEVAIMISNTSAEVAGIVKVKCLRASITPAACRDFSHERSESFIPGLGFLI